MALDLSVKVPTIVGELEIFSLSSIPLPLNIVFWALNAHDFARRSRPSALIANAFLVIPPT
jgi:hypothetical protein